ncbi:MAG: hypothetical protein ACFE9S_11945 [Candidatus Hermodarchaeota archaeon]
MNIVTEILRYIILIIIGIALINWHDKKKGWEHRFRTSLFFILIWRTIIFLLLILMNFILVPFLEELPMDFYLFYPITYLTIIFFGNIYIGVSFFKIFYKQKKQESIYIILIIVIIEIILESFFFYVILISDALL